MDDVLSQCGGEISVTYRVDAVGRVLAGEEPQVVTPWRRARRGGPHLGQRRPAAGPAGRPKAGQRGRGGHRGAGVQNPGGGQRAGLLPLDLSEATQREDAPLVNRPFRLRAGLGVQGGGGGRLAGGGPGELTFTCVGSLNAGGCNSTVWTAQPTGSWTWRALWPTPCNCYFINAARCWAGRKSSHGL